jgi:4,5-dihydroxyphthalate decarboxylase
MTRKLSTVTRTQGANQALKDGTIEPEGFEFAFEEVPVLVRAFRRMVRELEFDVCEMAMTTYLTAKEHGVAFTALPIFLVRGLHHGAIHVKAGSRVQSPNDLLGRRVGVNRGYTVTTGVWARGILASQYGVDLDRITWVPSGDEHVLTYEPPMIVQPAEAGEDLITMLLGGAIDAIVGAEIEHPEVVPLIPDPKRVAFAALAERGFYPINHTVVIRDDVLHDNPDVAAAVFDAFAAAKSDYVRRLLGDEIAEPTSTDLMYREVHEVTGADPLPFGLTPNRAMLEELIGYARDQHILRRPTLLEDVFEKSTLTREG